MEENLILKTGARRTWTWMSFGTGMTTGWLYPRFSVSSVLDACDKQDAL